MIEINCLDDVPIFLGAQRLTDYFRGKVGYTSILFLFE